LYKFFILRGVRASIYPKYPEIGELQPNVIESAP